MHPRMSAPPYRPEALVPFGEQNSVEEALVVEAAAAQSSAPPQPESQSSPVYPLSGALVYLLVPDPDSAALVAALGGRPVARLEDATHALYSGSGSGLGSNPAARNPAPAGLEALVVGCQARDVPIVDLAWLERMSGLREGEHWSEVDVSAYVPPVVAALNHAGLGADAGAAIAADAAAARALEEREAWEAAEAVARGAVAGADAISEAEGDAGGGRRGKAARRMSASGLLRRTFGRRNSNGSAGAHPEAPASTGPPPPSLVPPPTSHPPRDAPSRLSRSITETFEYLSRERPDMVEEENVRRAMELSMLDVALVLRGGRGGSGGPSFGAGIGEASQAEVEAEEPHMVLGVARDAPVAEIRAAYRKLALAKHPDKGGTADEFFRVARAYRALLDPGRDAAGTSAAATASSSPTPSSMMIKSTAHWDAELQDHRRLVGDLFASHGADLQRNVRTLLDGLDTLGLVAEDAGSVNVNERNERIRNSCFYLSLARSYLAGIGALACPSGGGGDGLLEEELRALRQADEALTGETALQLKRLVEAAVVRAHPEWAAKGLVGEEVQAFSDFLVYTLDSSTLLADWAIAVFDTTSGFVDVYKGGQYERIAAKDPGWARSSTITLRYVPGHYLPLIPSDPESRPSLANILKCLDDVGVFYVVTDGTA